MEMEMNSHLDRGIRVEVLAHFVIEGRELLAVAAPRRVKLDKKFGIRRVDGGGEIVRREHDHVGGGGGGGCGGY